MGSKVLKCVTFIIELAFLVVFIVCTTFLFKVNRDAKDEPTSRGRYIADDPYNYYTDEEFCINHYEPYIYNGAFKEFNLRIKKIKKFSIILIVILFVKMAVSILATFLGLCGQSAKCSCFIYLLLILSSIAELLFLIFFIIISVHYFKSKFGRFDTFSECKYLGRNFGTDYDFVFDLKKSFKIFFILGIISFVLNGCQIFLNRKLKKDKDDE